MGHPKIDLFIPLSGVVGISRALVCFGDYYPIIPFIFMYLAGYFAARTAQRCEKPVPNWAYANPLPALAQLGRHALPFYLLHQPIILGVLELIYSVR